MLTVAALVPPLRLMPALGMQVGPLPQPPLAPAAAKWQRRGSTGPRRCCYGACTGSDGRARLPEPALPAGSSRAAAAVPGAAPWLAQRARCCCGSCSLDPGGDSGGSAAPTSFARSTTSWAAAASVARRRPIPRSSNPSQHSLALPNIVAVDLQPLAPISRQPLASSGGCPPHLHPLFPPPAHPPCTLSPPPTVTGFSY